MVTTLTIVAAIFGLVALAVGLNALYRTRNRAFLKVRRIRLKDLPDK